MHRSYKIQILCSIIPCIVTVAHRLLLDEPFMTHYTINKILSNFVCFQIIKKQFRGREERLGKNQREFKPLAKTLRNA